MASRVSLLAALCALLTACDGTSAASYHRKQSPFGPKRCVETSESGSCAKAQRKFYGLN